MNKTKSTKRALIMSVMALFLCFAMLLGTTYAWFTDSAVSGSNVITAGNLDVVVEYTLDGEKWNNLDGATDLFRKGLWEPGHTEVVALRIKNNGSLALNYTANMNIVEETVGKTKDEKDIVLSDILMVSSGTYGITDQIDPFLGFNISEKTLEVAFADESSLVLTNTASFKESNVLGANQTLIAGDAQYLIIRVDLPETVGNEANAKDKDTVPFINFGINVFATQAAVESDTFGKDYDAGNAVYTVADANAAMLADSKDVMLVGANEPESILNIPAAYTGTLTIVNSRVKSVQAAGDANVAIQGSVVVNAKGSGLSTFAATTANGSAITAEGTLNISGSGVLTAIAADENGAFGIGGMNTKAINIEDVTIALAKGGHAYGVGTDTKYYKDAPEGGAAIGSAFNGANITLENVVVEKAIGGSKAAGIGARYWTGVTVNIKDSVLAYVEGGVSAAGIGGSRVSSDLTESDTTVNITNSDVTAKGGAYGAGIGSGYDTHCASMQPMCTINITDSTINATGGKYAAGVGTGYHNAALSGEIKNSTVNAVSGEKFYKDSYTQAQDIGFGVVDPAREGQQKDSYIIYNGEKITIPMVADKWDGTADTSWYDPENPQTEYTFTTAEQIMGLSELCSGDTTFAGVTFTLANDLDLYCEDTSENADGDPVTFRPIGDISKDGTFEGIFDGAGHTITNLYQNGWDLGYQWGIYGSYGLFGNVNNATIKNLTISGSESYIEGGDTSFVTGSATGTCVFENITIKDSVSATYNNGNGGIIGWSGAGDYTFKNITIAEDCVVAGLWGSFDSSIGGIVGQAEPGATYNFENVEVNCRIDAYNDCTASYDYYNYRMCGMLIGRCEETTTIDGTNYPDTSKYNITCTNVTVNYGDWMNYHYCDPTPGYNGGRGMRVEAGYSYDGLPADYDHSQCTTHHNKCIPFNQIIGGDQLGVKGLPSYEGVTVNYPASYNPEG